MSALTTLTEDNKRWLVFGIALNHVLIPSIRPVLKQEILKEYNDLKTNHGINVQTSHSFPVSRYPNVMNYENINSNHTKLKPPQYKRLDHSKFDYQVTSHVDFAKLFLQNHMAKFNAFNETLDASAVLNLLGRIPVFSVALQTAANVVREGRNAWGHCNFTDWNEANFKTRFKDMEQLVTEMSLSPADESKVLSDLKDWEDKGVILCMNATIDPQLAKVVQERVSQLFCDVGKMAFETQEDLNNLKKTIQELTERIKNIEQEVLQPNQSSIDFSSCEADINYYTHRYDPDTRHWLLKDFDMWFSQPVEARAYVLLGDAAVGKSVMAAVIAQRARDHDNLAAAYFCRHNDGTRRDPRYLLGTIAHQLRNCHSEYDRAVGGDTGIQKMLANDKLGVHELFTKLLEEPLGKCISCERKLVVVDALDETEYWSREDFLDLITCRFPQLPNWLVFFITSRPEDTVQFRLKAYNPCIRICAGSSGSADFYRQHEQDIQQFLEKRIDFSRLSYSAKHLTNKCNGMFLYAFYVVEFLKNSTRIDSDILPENIDAFFYNNFKRVCEKIGCDFYKKLFGCALVAPSPLPVSFISFLLQEDCSALDEQEIVDTVSQFVAWRTSDKTFAFLHNLIPAWLTDKERASRRLFIDKDRAKKYFRKIVVEFLSSYLKEKKDFLSCDSRDLVDYILENGIRFLCNGRVELSGSSEMIFNCLTNYRFLQHRIQSKIGIYSLIEDFKLSFARQTCNERKKNILVDICAAIEQDKDVIGGNPELLYSCLRNATKLSQESIISGNVSTSWMELELDLAFSVKETLGDMNCGAFSHDKKLFASGKGGYIYLYDASSFRKIFGPFEVMSEGIILHLEFLPDDRFVFFGRLDFWFSIQEKRVVKIIQFAGTSECYQWGSFVYEGKFIAVRRKLTFEKHKKCCLEYLFYKWIVKEFDLEQGNRHENISRKFSSFCRGDCNSGVCLISSLRYMDDNLEEIKLRLCSRCAKFENLETCVRDRIVALYADLFEYQIWNVQTGRPVIEQMFSSQVKLKPFFYFWHMPRSISNCDYEVFEHITLASLAVLYFLSVGRRFSYGLLELEVLQSRSSSGFAMTDFGPVERVTNFVKNTPVECCNYLFKNSLICCLSKNGRWLASYNWSELKLCALETDGKGSLNHQQDVDLGIAFLPKCAFTSDSNILVYITRSEDQDRAFFAFAIHTGLKLRSLSGIYPLRCQSVEGHGIGYIFFARCEERTVLLKDLPWEILCYSIGKLAKTINVAFTSTDRIMLVLSNAAYMLLDFVDGNWATTRQCVLNHKFPTHICVKKCIFSNEGRLVAIHESCQLLLFNDNKFLCSVFKVEETCERTITCLTFSPDNCLLSFCVQKGNDVQSFYVWDVQRQVLHGPVVFPYRMSVDCCCFSSNNTKLLLCNASSVLILEDPPNFGRFSKHYNVPYVDYRTSQLCAWCTVSSDDKLLACCVGNEILIYPINGPDTFWKVPHNHLGRIEFCKFITGNRYLISYGIDCVVVLFDISEWKPVAYARMQESIISMAVSPDEEKVVCLKSSGDVSIFKLHGLKYGLPSNFQLPSNFGSPEGCHKPPVPPERHIIVPPNQTEFEEDEMMSADDFCESIDGDESDEMYVESDHSEDQICEDQI